MLEQKRTAAIPNASVGADAGQPPIVDTHSIPDSEPEINWEDEIFRKIQRMSEPDYLPTISHAELFDKTYPSKPPLIDGLLYPGAYLLAGAPKVGKSFLVAQIAYHVSTGEPLWGYSVRQGTVL